MRVLAIIPGGIDDQVLFLPTLQHLHAVLPQAEVAVAAEPEAKAFYQLSKLVDEVIPYSFGSGNSPADWANLLGVIRDREFEVVITATTNASMALLLWLSGVPTRIGYEAGSNDLLLTRTVPLRSQQPLMEQYHDLLAGLGISGPCPQISLNLPQRELAWAESIRQQAQLDGQGYVLVYPGESQATATETYPVENWTAILKDFQTRQPDLPLVVMQTEENFAIATALAQAVSGVKLATPDTLAQGAALIAGANLVLSTDSYPLYLAVALGVFALGLFGRNDPQLQLPAADGETRVLGLSADSGSLSDIAPETVLKRVWNEG